MTSRYLSTQEVTRVLGISPATLYSYVSRGLIRSEAVVGSRRERRYHAEDVERLKRRKEQRHDPERVAERALNWGSPVLDSALTLIADNRVYYRGHDVLRLAQQRSFEEVAALLWTDGFEAAPSLFAAESELSPACRSVLLRLTGLPTAELFQVLLPIASTEDPGGGDLRPAAVARTGARIVRLLVEIVLDGWPTAAERGIARRLQQRWAPDRPEFARLLDAALIMCADHELNVSSFTVRCVASSGATPYAAVIAGLSALQGFKHGRHTERVEAVFQEAASPTAARSTLARRIKLGELLPGFGHQLYPLGDPRGAALLQFTREACPGAPAVALAQALAAEALDLLDVRPTIDFALVTLARALDLPADGALTMFALGRTAGWIGHAIEQYRLDRLIRPRARYVGRQPSDE